MWHQIWDSPKIGRVTICQHFGIDLAQGLKVPDIGLIARGEDDSKDGEPMDEDDDDDNETGDEEDEMVGEDCVKTDKQYPVFGYQTRGVGVEAKRTYSMIVGYVLVWMFFFLCVLSLFVL